MFHNCHQLDKTIINNQNKKPKIKINPILEHSCNRDLRSKVKYYQQIPYKYELDPSILLNLEINEE